MTVFAPGARAGGWPLPPDTSQIVIRATQSSADTQFSHDGERRDILPYRKREIAAYGEHGLFKDLTLLGELAWKQDRKNWHAGARFIDQGFSRAKLGIRYALGEWQGTEFSFQPVATVHLMKSGDDPSMPGPGDTDIEAGGTLASSDTLLGMEIFSVQEIGYSFSGGGRPDRLRADVTLGLKPLRDVMLLIESRNAANLGDLRRQGTQESKLYVSLVYDVTQNWSLELGALKTVFGRNALDESGVTLGLWHRF
ncbi:hypothetical protein FHS78_000429 [Parvibaculum indicum]|uniref:hypothetical protein n=1 Tax=Parvibaculum indicum TaxID=562969 RepID=UPI00141E7416|nr:hypothetical protein [Parvibaculum indicum]NIJ40174.1 hypothetical protein [Parvibaculum indicum]